MEGYTGYMHRIVAFVLAEGPLEHGTPEDVTAYRESGPAYVAESIPRQFILEQHGDLTLKAYHPNVLLAECVRDVDDVFSNDAYETRIRMIRECRHLLEQRKAKMKINEEYAIAIVDGYEGAADQFLARDREIVRFLKSELLPLHRNEIEYALQHRITYGEHDLVIVDWDGAFVFQQNGRADAIIDLLQMANLHLLQYRMLDDDLDHRLRRIEKLIRTKAVSRVVFWNRELSRAYKEVIRMQATSIVEFDAIVREIKLIGDWFSARLYETAAQKFKLDGWRSTVRDKLGTLEDAYGIISQNFRISKEYVFEMMLQLGWLILILLEVYHIVQ